MTVGRFTDETNVFIEGKMGVQRGMICVALAAVTCKPSCYHEQRSVPF